MHRVEAMEPDLPLEFLVAGTAVSAQASSASRTQWRSRVSRAGSAGLEEGAWLLTDAVSVTIYLFPAAALAGDVDNRVKPILDAMTGTIYADDALVERLVVQKFEPDRVFAFSDPSTCLLDALRAQKPLVYVRVTGDPHEELS